MKTTIITMTSTYNYGATMQAYALQEFLKGLGHECEIIDHMSSPNKHRKINLFDFSRENLKMLPYKFVLQNGYRSFEDFYDDHMNMTSRYATYEELKENPPICDAYITGSDQVWNPRDKKLDRFFLEFAPEGKKKISYAASLGDPSIPDEKKEIYRDYLKGFDGISVREQEGYDIISGLTDREVNINIDPVFLLDKERWNQIEKPVKGLPKDYILCYFIYLPPWFNSWARKLSEKTGKKIVFVGLHGCRGVEHDYYVRNAGPGEFLWLIHNASMIVSSSYHGNAFSVLYNKEFISLPDPKRPDRIKNLLRMFDMEDHMIFEDTMDYVSAARSEDDTRAIIEAQREKSQKYLTGALS